MLGTRADRDRVAWTGDPGSARAPRAGRPGTGLPPVPSRSSGRRGRGRPDRFGPVLAGGSGVPRDGPVAGESRRDLAVYTEGASNAGGSSWGSTAWIGRRLPITWCSSDRPAERADVPGAADRHARRRVRSRTGGLVVARPRRQCGVRRLEAVRDAARGAGRCGRCSSRPTPDGIPPCWPRAGSGRPTSSPAASPIRWPSPSAPILRGSWSGPGGRRRVESSVVGRCGSSPRRSGTAEVRSGRGGRLVLRRSPERAQRSGRPTAPGLRGRTGAGLRSTGTPSATGRRRAGDPGRR